MVAIKIPTTIGLIMLLVSSGGFIALVVQFGTGYVSAATTVVSGSITTDTTWTLADSPYIIVDDITVEATATLTIEAGVEVKFDGYYTLTVNGRLLAQGTEANKITFTSNKATPAKGDWNSIRLVGDNNRIENATITYGTFPIYISMYSQYNLLKNTEITQSVGDGVYSKGFRNKIIGCNISQHDGYGLNLFQSNNNTIRDTKIWSNTGYGIYLEASFNTVIDGCEISENNKGIYVYNYANNTWLNNTKVLSNNADGIDLGGSSYWNISNCNISLNGGVGINFGSALAQYNTIYNCELWNNIGDQIQLRGGDYNTIRYTSITDGQAKGIYFGVENAGTYNVIDNCEIIGNADTGIFTSRHHRTTTRFRTAR